MGANKTMRRPNIALGESLSQTGQRLLHLVLLSGAVMALLLLTACGAEPAVSSTPDAPAPPRNFPSPAISTVNGDARFDDEPALAQASDGSFYLAWNRFRDGADSLQFARFERNGDRFGRAHQTR